MKKRGLLDFSDNLNICDIFYDIKEIHKTQLQVWEEDGLPNMICHPCKYQLEKSYQFKKKCEAADTKLRKHMKMIQRLTGQDEEGERLEGNEDSEEPSSSSGKSRQVKQLLADLVATKGDANQEDGDPIQVTEEELVGGYILGKCYDIAPT